MADITINGITVDPLAAAAPQPAGIAAAAAPIGGAASAAALSVANTKYLLVQVDHPLNKGERNKLEALGATVLEYVPENTYVCRYDPDDAAPVRQLPFVKWTGPYLRGFKVAASLASAGAARMSLAVAAAGPTQTMSDMPTTVDVLFHNDADAEQAAREVATAAALDPADVVPAGNKVRVTVATSRLSQLANVDDVRTIEPVIPVKLHNDVARTILRVDRPNPGPLPFDGDGQIVAVADTGFDKGSTMNVHPAFTGRVKKLYPLGRVGKANDPNGHGTHVAGSVLGDGVLAPANTPVQGTAPKAELILQSLLDAQGGLGGIPLNLANLFSPPMADGASVHTNSWGSTLGDGRYDSQSNEVDAFVWANRTFIICFSAGNEGVDFDGDGTVDPRSITPPGTAKNCITIGATESHRPTFTTTYGAWWPQDFPVNPLASDRVATNRDGMVAFSSRGPTADRRFKPDLVAPGTYILSARSRDTASSGWSASTDPLYMYEGGTSMATPLVAGCCALVREYLAEQRAMPAPSAALVKAMLINGAIDVPGQYTPSEAGPIPNFSEGFGRVDMDATLGHGATNIVLLADEADALDTGEERVFDVDVPAGATALKVTLVWTDPPGATLQNDLDLIVRAGAGQERHGNVAANSAAFDRTNNVEQVVWDAPPAGPVTVTVRAYRVPRFAQSFALVVRLSS